MGGRHRARFEACGVEFVAVLDKECSNESVLTASIAGKEFDFAVVATPASSHYGYAKFFLERKIPVLLNGFAGRWPELYQFMEYFPKNVFIAQEGVGKWGNDRLFRPQLENFENFYFETAGYWVPEGIRDLAGRYGAERILYGSGFPRYNQGNGMLQLRQSGLPLSSIELIAGKNLDRILRGAEL